MKTVYLILILGSIILGSAIFAVLFEFPFAKENYEIKINGLKDVYLVGEPYSFSYLISGYGYSCADRSIAYPDANGDTLITRIDADCNSDAHKTKFAIDSKNESIFENIKIKQPGRYNVGVMFEKSTSFEPTQAGKEFHVVEKICNSSNAKDRAQCFADSYKQCESAYMTQQFSTENGSVVNLRAVVESWNDCTLRVYSENLLGEDTPFNGIRSICENLVVAENSLHFENCNNAEFPPIPLFVDQSEFETSENDILHPSDNKCNQSSSNLDIAKIPMIGEPSRLVFSVKQNTTAHICIKYSSNLDNIGELNLIDETEGGYLTNNNGDKSNVQVNPTPSLVPRQKGQTTIVDYVIFVPHYASGVYWLGVSQMCERIPIVTSDHKLVSDDIPIVVGLHGCPAIMLDAKIVGYSGADAQYYPAKALQGR